MFGLVAFVVVSCLFLHFVVDVCFRFDRVLFLCLVYVVALFHVGVACHIERVNDFNVYLKRQLKGV